MARSDTVQPVQQTRPTAGGRRERTVVVTVTYVGSPNPDAGTILQQWLALLYTHQPNLFAGIEENDSPQ